MDPTELAITFDDDHSATVSFMGEKVGTSKWSMLTETIVFDDTLDNGVNLNGDYKDGELILNYSSDDNYYVFTMSNSGNAAATDKTSE